MASLDDPANDPTLSFAKRLWYTFQKEWEPLDFETQLKIETQGRSLTYVFFYFIFLKINDETFLSMIISGAYK